MPSQPSPARLEAFSDGVIAVIITIMVLELHVPHASGLAGLLAVLPTLAVYLLSFVFTGIYWVNHHTLIHRLRFASPAVLWANLALLFALSLLPFFTSWLIEKHFDSPSTALYAGSLLLPALAFQILSATVARQLHHLRQQQPIPAEELHQHRLELRKGWVSFVAYLAGAALSYVHPHLALGLLASVTLIWIVPGFGTRRPEHCPHAEQSNPLSPDHP